MFDRASAAVTVLMANHSFETIDHGTYRVVIVRGAVDLGNAKELADVLESAIIGAPIVVDLSACSYLDSTGLSIFVRHERMRRRRTAIVAPPGNRPLHLLEITGLALTLAVVPTLDAGIAFCGEPITDTAAAV